MVFPLGTIINIVAVILGSSIGLIIRNKLPEKYKKTIFQGIGLFTIVLGISMALPIPNPLIIIFSILIGGLIGTFLKVEDRLENLSSVIKRELNLKDSQFNEGLITAFLIYCIGSMTILGAINEGIKGDSSLLMTKSVLDGFTSIALSSTFGIGVMFSTIPMLIFQGGLTVLASLFGNFFTESLIQYLSCTGGILILGIGFNLLEIKKISILNLLPSLIIVVILFLLFI
ncbi:MAG: DUF554 domain-containing protein [Candidatus Dojkabacteria bacterium]